MGNWWNPILHFGPFYKFHLFIYNFNCLCTNFSCLFTNISCLFTNISCLFTIIVWLKTFLILNFSSHVDLEPCRNSFLISLPIPHVDGLFVKAVPKSLDLCFGQITFKCLCRKHFSIFEFLSWKFSIHENGHFWSHLWQLQYYIKNDGNLWS